MNTFNIVAIAILLFCAKQTASNPIPWSTRLSMLAPHEAFTMYASWTRQRTDNARLRDAFVRNHEYVVLRNKQLKLEGASYELELNEVWATHEFADDSNGNRVDKKISAQVLQPGYLDWREKVRFVTLVIVPWQTLIYVAAI
jgi:hypothetical protein